jgi:hypothetical protein
VPSAEDLLILTVVLHGPVAERIRVAAAFAGKAPDAFIADFCSAAFQPGMC